MLWNKVLLITAVLGTTIALSLQEAWAECQQEGDIEFLPFASKAKQQPIFVPHEKITIESAERFGSCVHENWNGSFAVLTASVLELESLGNHLLDKTLCPEWMGIEVDRKVVGPQSRLANEVRVELYMIYDPEHPIVRYLGTPNTGACYTINTANYGYCYNFSRTRHYKAIFSSGDGCNGLSAIAYLSEGDMYEVTDFEMESFRIYPA